MVRKNLILNDLSFNIINRKKSKRFSKIEVTFKKKTHKLNSSNSADIYHFLTDLIGNRENINVVPELEKEKCFLKTKKKNEEHPKSWWDKQRKALRCIYLNPSQNLSERLIWNAIKFDLSKLNNGGIDSFIEVIFESTYSLEDIFSFINNKIGYRDLGIVCKQQDGQCFLYSSNGLSFGVLWWRKKIDTLKQTNVFTILNFNMLKFRFPGVKGEGKYSFIEVTCAENFSPVKIWTFLQNIIEHDRDLKISCVLNEDSYKCLLTTEEPQLWQWWLHQLEQIQKKELELIKIQKLDFPFNNNSNTVQNQKNQVFFPEYNGDLYELLNSPNAMWGGKLKDDEKDKNNDPTSNVDEDFIKRVLTVDFP